MEPNASMLILQLCSYPPEALLLLLLLLLLLV
jgi:hypothetical protein